MLVLARQVRGLTQIDLATKLGVSQGKISKIEQGLIAADSDTIERISDYLDFPKDFFTQSGQIFPSEISLYRKRQSLTKRGQDQINALLNLKYLQLNRLLQSIEIDSYVPFMDLDELQTPHNVAKKLRQYWQIPRGRIENLTALVESAGIFVLHIDTSTNRFDGIRFIADARIPIVALNKNMPPDRMRFTLAHEIGHILMHKIVTTTADEEANAFASEFLMPSDEIEFPIKGITLSHLADLKRYWRVSMAALIQKARDLKVINNRQYQYLWMQMGKHGYRVREPIELDPPFETPTLISEILRLHLNQLNYSEMDILKMFQINQNDFEDWWGQYLPPKEKKPILKLVRGGVFYEKH